MMDITIRKARSQDIDRMLVLLEELSSIEKDFTFNPAKNRKGLEMLIADTKDKALFVASFQEQIVGMCSVQAIISTAEGQKASLIEDLVVEKGHRRKRIASSLISTIGRWALKRGIKRLQLLADNTNKSALSFYDGTGWSKTQLICLRKYAGDT